MVSRMSLEDLHVTEDADPKAAEYAGLLVDYYNELYDVFTEDGTSPETNLKFIAIGGALGAIPGFLMGVFITNFGGGEAYTAATRAMLQDLEARGFPVEFLQLGYGTSRETSVPVDTEKFLATSEITLLPKGN